MLLLLPVIYYFIIVFNKTLNFILIGRVHKFAHACNSSVEVLHVYTRVKRTADLMALCLSLVFRRLVRLGILIACWRQANVTPIPKDPPSSYFANCRPISLTSLLSKVFEHLASVPLGRFMEA